MHVCNPTVCATCVYLHNPSMSMVLLHLYDIIYTLQYYLAAWLRRRTSEFESHLNMPMFEDNQSAIDMTPQFHGYTNQPSTLGELWKCHN